MTSEIAIRKFFDLKEIDKKHSIKGLTIKDIEGHNNNLGEFMITITTEERFQMANSPEGRMTNRFVIFVDIKG